mmetsp:Transcript_24665/g.79841  ORF Transcript_24665/g.79841 Transcript_24665/m.79841 type:complete len:170 (-) Transcript_24665:329-838(-)
MIFDGTGLSPAQLQSRCAKSLFSSLGSDADAAASAADDVAGIAGAHQQNVPPVIEGFLPSLLGSVGEASSGMARAMSEARGARRRQLPTLESPRKPCPEQPAVGTEEPVLTRLCSAKDALSSLLCQVLPQCWEVAAPESCAAVEHTGDAEHGRRTNASLQDGKQLLNLS